MTERFLCDTCRLKVRDTAKGVLCEPEWPYTPKKRIREGQSPMYVCASYMSREVN